MNLELQEVKPSALIEMAALPPCCNCSGDTARELALPANEDKLTRCTGILPPGYTTDASRQILIELLLLV